MLSDGAQAITPEQFDEIAPSSERLLMRNSVEADLMKLLAALGEKQASGQGVFIEE